MEDSLVKWLIYEHISPSGKVYVGITSKSPNERWRYGSGYSNCVLFQKAITKYGWNNIQHIIVASGLGEQTAKNMEIDMIKHYKNRGISYNITDGGDGILGYSWRPSLDTRIKWSKQRKGRELNDEWKSKISESMKKSSYRISTESHKKSIEILKVKLSKPVIQLSISGEYIREWSSIKEAARHFNISDSDIIRVCKGKRKTRAGYKWRYKED